MDTLKRYDVLDEDGEFVLFKDAGQSGYESPVCYDRKNGRFFNVPGGSLQSVRNPQIKPEDDFIIR